MNRGGSWNNDASNCRSANRNRNSPDNRNNNLGFRVALSSLWMWMHRTEPTTFLSDRKISDRQNTGVNPLVLVAAVAQSTGERSGGFFAEIVSRIPSRRTFATRQSQFV